MENVVTILAFVLSGIVQVQPSTMMNRYESKSVPVIATVTLANLVRIDDGQILYKNLNTSIEQIKTWNLFEIEHFS